MKRRVVFILLLLVGGAIFNVAVAWGIALTVLRFDETAKGGIATKLDETGRAVESLWAHRFEGPGTTWYAITWWRWNLSESDFEGHQNPFELLQSRREFEPSRDFLEKRTDREDQSVMFRGWPCHSLACAFLLGRIRGAPSIPSKAIVARVTRDGELLLLPLDPIWPGFAINTLFYAGILWGGWLLFAAPFALRRRRRIKRGLCPACAYPVGGSPVCTECGADVMARPVG